MDINQSSLSRSKLNKPGIARSRAEHKAISESARVKENQALSSSSSAKQAGLSEGQIIKGQIIDHRYQEVKIQLEPSKQIITAKLSGDVPLAIGQEAQFIVSEDGLDRLVLRYLPESTSPSDATILKALSASGLPYNERNRTLVEELLKHTMPVDKQTLQSLVRLSNTNREAAPLTLVLMYKNNLPMTPANIRQFEAYQNGTGRLLTDIQHITKGVSELISTALPQGLPTNGTNNLNYALQVNNRMLDILTTNQNHPNSQMPEAMDRNALIAQLEQGTLSHEEAVDHLKTMYPNATPNLLSEISQSLALWREAPSSPSPFASLDRQLLETEGTLRPIQNLLAPSEQASLAELLRSIPSLRPIADRMMEGTLSSKELFTSLQYNLPQLEAYQVEQILTSPHYQSLVEKAFLDKWTITPEKLSDEAGLRSLYDNLREDMEQLSSLAELEQSSKDFAKLQEPIKNLQENMRFMQDLNRMFTYLQLPVQFKNQEVHTELYVFTRKRALQQKEDLSVLLHLDMTHLGSLNIHIRLEHNNIHAKFYIEEEEARGLITDCMPTLTETLGNKGYRLFSEVSKAYEKLDFSKDFIDDSSGEGDVRRYTFDIRT